jgi:hypothetical protein
MSILGIVEHPNPGELVFARTAITEDVSCLVAGFVGFYKFCVPDVPVVAARRVFPKGGY